MPVVYDRGDYSSIVQGGRGFGESIGAGLATLGQGIGAALERKKTEQKLAKQAEQMLTTLAGMPEFGDKGAFAGLIPKNFAMDRPRKELPGVLSGVFTAVTLRQKMQQMAHDQQAAAALAEERQARTAALTREGQAETAFGQALALPPGQVMQYDEPNWQDRAIVAEGDPLSRPETRDETVRRGFRQFPAALSVPNVGDRVKALQGLGTGEEDLTPNVWEDPKTGLRIYRSGKSNIPTGVNPERGATAAQAIYDENGEVIGHGVPTGRGIQIIQRKQATPSKVRVMLNPDDAMDRSYMEMDYDAAEKRGYVKPRKGATTEEGQPAAGTAAERLALGKQLIREHPTWTKAEVLAELNRRLPLKAQ